jgi:hypothetical protein
MGCFVAMLLDVAQGVHQLAEIRLEPSELADQLAQGWRLVGNFFFSHAD